MRILITGGTGLLGSALIRNKPANLDVFATFYNNKKSVATTEVEFIYLDIRSKRDVKLVLDEIRPDVIIHAAAKSSPDYCEENKKDAWQTNVIGTRNILELSKKKKIKVIFMSSNQVFSGTNPPYTEKSLRDPVNYYGKTKVKSEDDIAKNKENACTVRLMTMYGWANPEGTKNTAVWVLDMLNKHEKIKVVDDIYNNFLYVDDAAKIIWNIAMMENYPLLVQLAGRTIASRYEFAKKISKEFGLNEEYITPVKKSYFKDEAPRPLNTIYDISLMEKIGFKSKTLLNGLRDMKLNKNKIEWMNIK